jgi:hypothetical protein
MEKSAKLDIFSQLNYQEVKMLQSETSKPSIQFRRRYNQPLECPTRRYKYCLEILCGTTTVLKQGTLDVHKCSGGKFLWMRHTVAWY